MYIVIAYCSSVSSSPLSDAFLFFFPFAKNEVSLFIPVVSVFCNFLTPFEACDSALRFLGFPFGPAAAEPFLPVSPLPLAVEDAIGRYASVSRDSR